MARHAHQAQPQGDRIAEAGVELPGGAAGAHRLAEAGGVVELPAVVVEHRGLLGRREAGRVGHDGLQMCERLAVRAGPGRLARGLRADREDGVDVAGRHRVVHQAGALGPILRAQRRDDGLVEQPHTGHGEAALDGAPRQLVAESEPVGAIFDDAGELGRGQRAHRLAEQDRGQIGRDVRGHHRQALERLAAVRVQAAQAGEHRVLDAGRHLAGRRGERLGDEERVAARQRVDGGRIAPGAAHQRLHGVARQRGELDAVHRAAGERAEQTVQGMARIELVAGRQDEDRADPLDAARRVAEHVEGGVVGPVDVLDDEDGRALLRELLQQRGEDAIDRGVVGQRGRQRAGAPQRRVVQRPQRARRDEVVARRCEDACPVAQALDQRPHEARLADAGLARDERRRAAPLRALRHCADEDLELCVALEQGLGHAHMVTDAELGSQSSQVGHRLPMCGAPAARTRWRC